MQTDLAKSSAVSYLTICELPIYTKFISREYKDLQIASSSGQQASIRGWVCEFSDLLAASFLALNWLLEHPRLALPPP